MEAFSQMVAASTRLLSLASPMETLMMSVTDWPETSPAPKEAFVLVRPRPRVQEGGGLQDSRVETWYHTWPEQNTLMQYQYTL